MQLGHGKGVPPRSLFHTCTFRTCTRASNKRMGIACCQIYLLHSPMHLFREIEYWVESAAICKRKGLLEMFGLSNCNADQVRRTVNAGEKVRSTTQCLI